MFDNVGSKIKGVSKFFCWLGIIFSILLGFAIMAAAPTQTVMPNGQSVLNIGGVLLAVIGFVVVIVGPILSWVGSLIVYGFGEMVHNSRIQTEIAVKQARKKEAAE